jgi:hypothetical protein
MSLWGPDSLRETGRPHSKILISRMMIGFGYISKEFNAVQKMKSPLAIFSKEGIVWFYCA